MKKLVKCISIIIVFLVIFDVIKSNFNTDKNNISNHNNISTSIFAKPINTGNAVLVSTK